jgi:hypothetical protein
VSEAKDKSAKYDNYNINFASCHERAGEGRESRRRLMGSEKILQPSSFDNGRVSDTGTGEVLVYRGREERAREGERV